VISSTTSPRRAVVYSAKAFCSAIDGYYLLGRGDAQGTHARQVQTIDKQAGFLEVMARNAPLSRMRANLTVASKDGYALAKDPEALAAFRAKNYNYHDKTTADYNSATYAAIDLFGPVIINECHTLPMATTTTG
jgi:hypothetical protein